MRKSPEPKRRKNRKKFALTKVKPAKAKTCCRSALFRQELKICIGHWQTVNGSKLIGMIRQRPQNVKRSNPNTSSSITKGNGNASEKFGFFAKVLKLTSDSSTTRRSETKRRQIRQRNSRLALTLLRLSKRTSTLIICITKELRSIRSRYKSRTSLFVGAMRLQLWKHFYQRAARSFLFGTTVRFLARASVAAPII